MIETPSGSVHVESEGEGSRPLVAITPIGAAAFAASVPDELRARFTLHIVELPGTGRSDGAPAEQTVHSVAVAVREVAAQLGPGALLFGHSMNGTLALAAAAVDSFDGAGVIAVGAPPGLPSSSDVAAQYWQETAEPRRKAMAAELIAAHEATDDEVERTRLRERYDRLRRWYDVDFDPTSLDALDRIDFAWVQAVFDSGATVDWRAVFGAITCPVLLALGEYDFIVPPSSWTDEPLPARTTVETFHRSGHTPFFEEPAAFVAAVDRWVLEPS